LSVVLLFPAGISLLDSARKQKLLNKQTDLNSIKSLSWKEFEELVGEAYTVKAIQWLKITGSVPTVVLT
jgi:restriction system protein